MGKSRKKTSASTKTINDLLKDVQYWMYQIANILMFCESKRLVAQNFFFFFFIECGVFQLGHVMNVMGDI